VTLPEPITPQPADREIPDTEVIVVSPPSPVFVDSTGRRRRVLRRLAYAFGALCMLYGGLISVSLAGGPVSSSAILPLPVLPDRPARPVAARPSPTPAPQVSTPSRAQLVGDPLPRRSVQFGRTESTLLTRRTPAAIPAPSRTTVAARPARSPSPAATTARPLESTTTPSASASPSASDSAQGPKPPITKPTAPPPAPPADTGGTVAGHGAAGGSGTDSSTGGGSGTGGSGGSSTGGTEGGADSASGDNAGGSLNPPTQPAPAPQAADDDTGQSTPDPALSGGEPA
jgi:uncharacterized membrane protein YgcG